MVWGATVAGPKGLVDAVLMRVPNLHSMNAAVTNQHQFQAKRGQMGEMLNQI